MVAYGQRDKFIQAVVTFTTSEKAREMSAPERQDLLAKIRDTYAPDITNDDWKEIVEGINGFKFVITDSVKNGEVTIIDDQLPKEELDLPENETKEEYEKEMEETTNASIDEFENKKDEQVETTDDDDDEIDDEDGETEEDDFSDPKPEPKPEPEKQETFGRFIKPKETKPTKINTSKLKGLLKKKKND